MAKSDGKTGDRGGNCDALSILFDMRCAVTDTRDASLEQAQGRAEDADTASGGAVRMAEYHRLAERGGHGHCAASDLIESVVSLVAARNRRDCAGLDQAVLGRISAAARASDPGCLRRLVDDLLADGMARTQLVDQYVPSVARLLGEGWCEDTVSFAEVTIATARLQSLLAEFGNCDGAGRSAPHIALLVRQNERHTLGAVVAAAQIRRMGFEVHLMLGRTDDEIASLLGGRRFEAILMSASGCDSLESIRELVLKVRNHSSAPIVLGGTLLEHAADVREATGADHVTADPKEALRLCGLKTHLRGAGNRAGSG